MNQLNLFDYGQLESETSTLVQQRTSEIKALVKRGVVDFVDVAKEMLDEEVFRKIMVAAKGRMGSQPTQGNG